MGNNVSFDCCGSRTKDAPIERRAGRPDGEVQQNATAQNTSDDSKQRIKLQTRSEQPSEEPISENMHDQEQGGVGVMLLQSDGKWVVKSVIKDSPAWSSGKITEGDILLSVDGNAVDHIDNLGELSKILMGPVGSVVVLRFSNGTTSETSHVTLVRATDFTGQGNDKKRVWRATRTDWVTDEIQSADI
uniref:PDZ domain-containing protein n=1 Tax=Hanusia phi TaxID=3032 RepID=A0A7S0I1B5_9CRYP|mmetsp:Transcript_790/g.1703  ORF Transcript_790/g.1703 Transcript_790/m.1703 type:complete len:188 (+) Transcript_790:16-579(+)